MARRMAVSERLGDKPMSIENKELSDKKILFLLDWKKQKDQSHDFMLGYQNGWPEGFDAGLATATTEIQELKSELASLKSMVEAATMIEFDNEDGYYTLQINVLGQWELSLDRTLIGSYESVTEAFTAINGGTK